MHQSRIGIPAQHAVAVLRPDALKFFWRGDVMDPVVAQSSLPIVKGAAPIILPNHLLAATDVAKQEKLSRMAALACQTIVMPVSIDRSIEQLNGMRGHLTKVPKRFE